MSAAWGRVTAGEIAKATSGEMISGRAETTLAGISTDTRKQLEGCVFWALKGERFDGNDFLELAFESGAAAVVAEQGRVKLGRIPSDKTAILVKDTLRALGDFAGWWRREHKVQVLALTGSNGKTTTKEMAAAVLELQGPVLKNPGNYNNLIGLPLSLLDLTETHARVVLEMGMNHPGEIGRLTEIAAPDVGLITNVARAHLEGMGDLRSVARAKGELFEKMGPGSLAVVNGDDPLVVGELPRFKGRVLTFGLGSGNAVRAEGIRELGREGLEFEIIRGDEKAGVRLSVPGRHNVMNALAAAAAAAAMGVSLSQAAQGLAGFRGVPGRFTVVDLPDGATLVDDTYNANPSSLAAALESLAPLLRPNGRVILGLGDMLELGAEAVSAHEEAGRAAFQHGADFIVVMGEHSEDVARGAREAGAGRVNIQIAESHEQMARMIRAALTTGDLILLKASRGVRLEEVVRRLKEGGGRLNESKDKNTGG
ncbi:MAG: UDP-N-acetylmuramoyl-tripeptide--D-alanyl-D-alanine ligase [Desulfobacteraceae bacterium]